MDAIHVIRISWLVMLLISFSVAMACLLSIAIHTTIQVLSKK